MIRFKRTKSLCKECPLRGEKKVWSLCEVDKPRVALLGEAPGAHEAEEGKPFVGPAGKWLKAAIGKTGMLFHSLYRMNVISCRPPRNDIGSFEALEALRCCTPGFLEELSYMEKLGIRVIVPLGNTATGALDLEGNISKIRGSVYVRQNGKQTTVVIPTFHPSFIMRGMLKEEGTWIADLTKARDLSIKKYVPPKEIFTTNPTLKDLQAFHKMCMEKKPLLGVDIETTALSPYYARIVVVGFALDGERAFSYPLLKQGGKPYWNGSTAKAEKYLKDILKKCPTMYQNALFDVRHLEEKGYEVGNIHDDVLLIHAAIHPELPHNLGYITSIYGTTPYWKGEFSQRAGSILEMEDETLRVYNLRDAAVLQQVRPDLLSDLKETGTESIYRNISLPLIRPILQMEKNGIGFSERKQAAFRKSLEKKAAHLTKDLYSLLNLPKSFNFSSSDHMRAFLYGDTPTSYKRAKEELKKYDENPKLRKDTKKYANLVEIVSTFSEVTPLIKLPRTTKTEGGDGATDKEAFISIQRMVVNRRNAVQNLKRPTPAHASELERLDTFLVFIEKFRELKKTEKLLSTYTNFPVGPDGRVHGEYMIHGTRTGRLSCVSEDTEIPTLFDGNVRIRNLDMSKPNWVWTHKNRFRLVRRKIYKGLDRMYEIRVGSGQVLKCTEEHKLLTPEGWKAVKFLQEGDEIYNGSQIKNPQGKIKRYYQSLLFRIKTYYRRLTSRVSRILSDDSQNLKGEYTSRKVQTREGASLLPIQNGFQESNDRKVHISTSSVEGSMFGPQRVYHEGHGWEEIFLPSHSNGASNEHSFTLFSTEWFCSTSYRRKWREQRLIESRLSNRYGPQEFTFVKTKIVEKTYVGIMGVWDIEVEEDHSYVTDGFIHHNSRNPNMQNIGKEVKGLFFAEEGNYLIQGDYSNLELRVLAYVAEDDVLMDIFDKGGNVHDINCKLLFEIDETHPMWKAARKASKIYIFGRNYGGSLNGVYQQVLKEVPDMPLTYQQFCAVDSKYRMAHPKYATWYDKTVEEVTRTRVLTTPFGRKRIFLGQEHEITREGLNTQIQSPAADIANLSLIALEKESRKGLFKMCGTVHDSILVETKKENLHKVVAIMKKCMEHKVTINGKMATFPVDFEYGENWGALKAYEKKEK